MIETRTESNHVEVTEECGTSQSGISNNSLNMKETPTESNPVEVS